MRLDVDDVLLYGYNAPPEVEVRPGQVQMARLIQETIQENKIAIVEGPVGSGKSRGYAVPALLADKRVVITTAKKQLQHQISQKDIPEIAKQLGKVIPVALIKGQSNYGCELKARSLKGLRKGEREQFIQWLRDSEHGDISEYPGKRPPFWFEATAEDCIGTSCRFAKTCGYRGARAKVKTAQVVVANHYVVAFDLRLGPGSALLGGEYDMLIIDEAHQAPAAFRSAFSVNISPLGIRRLQKRIMDAPVMITTDTGLEKAWESMFKKIRYIEGEIPADPFEEAGERTASILNAVLEEVKVEAADMNLSLTGVRGPDEEMPDNWEEEAQMRMLYTTLTKTLGALKRAKEPDENSVVYVNSHADAERKSVTIAPISVGPLVGAQLKKIPSSVITSATIAVNESFQDIRYQMGLLGDEDKKVEELVVESPFDFRKQALLYIPKDIPLPVSQSGDEEEREEYLQSITMECRRLLMSSGGDAFILFTSTSDLNEVHERLEREDIGIHLIPQGDDAEAALREFQRTPNSAILGLKSFWEGVDVVGDKLRLVIITKLPFPIFGDPVLQARSRQMFQAALERGLNERAANNQVFNQLQIPAMLTDLRQGAGRLIRSKTDKGVLAVLDTRIWTGSGKRVPTKTQRTCTGYGALAVKAIGFSQRTDQFTLVSRFLAHLAKRAEKGAA